MYLKRSLVAYAVLTAPAMLSTLSLSACGDDDDNNETVSVPTLDGAKPLVIAHRGLPGLYPEETQISYEKAAEAGADFLEQDLHLSKDCVLVVRHNPWLSDNTDIEDVAASNPEVAKRKRTVPGRLVDVGYDVAVYGGPKQYLTDLTDPNDPKSVLGALIVDGEDHTDDWSITDFTAAELKQWVHGTTYDDAAERPTVDNGQYPVLTFQEVLDLAKDKGDLAVYPEAKNPVWNNEQALANGCGTAGSTHPFEDAILKIIEDNGLNAKDAPIIVQSFDPESLKYLRSIGLQTRVVQLIDGNTVNYETGDMGYATEDEYTFVDGRPYSWTLSGDPRYFDVMLTPEGLAEIKTYADGIGPWKPQVFAWQIKPFPGTNSDSTPFTGTLADVNSVTPKSVIADAHAAGLFVHSYTFRDETRYLPGYYQGDAKAEYKQAFEAGIDGVFSDFATTAIAAREEFFAGN